MITLCILFLIMGLGMIKFAIQASWSIMKILFGLGLFIACPMLVIWILVSGMLGIGLIPALLIAWIFSAAFKRA